MWVPLLCYIDCPSASLKCTLRRNTECAPDSASLILISFKGEKKRLAQFTHEESEAMGLKEEPKVEETAKSQSQQKRSGFSGGAPAPHSSHFPKTASLPPSLWWPTPVAQSCLNCNSRARAALQNFKIGRQIKKERKPNKQKQRGRNRSISWRSDQGDELPH